MAAPNGRGNGHGDDAGGVVLGPRRNAFVRVGNAMNWTYLLIGFVGLGTVVRFYVQRRREMRAFDEPRRLACPRTAAEVDCVLRRDPSTGHWTSVRKCSGWPTQRDCDSSCIRFLELGIPLDPARPEAEPPV